MRSTLIRASALVRPSRFAIVNPDCADWGASDWFMPHAGNGDSGDACSLSLWVRKSNGLLYGRAELAPSIPVHRSPERLACVRSYDEDSGPDAIDSEVGGTPVGQFWTRSHALEASYQAAHATA
jgi:hypothetical protein